MKIILPPNPYSEKLRAFLAPLVPPDSAFLDPEEGWDVCLSINYLSNQRPSGVFFGFHVEGRRQPEGFDLLWLPGGRFLRVEINESTAQALDSEPWTGGVPPYQWISDSLGPRLGFQVQDNALPIVEYYRHNPDGSIAGCWLYVPVAG